MSNRKLFDRTKLRIRPLVERSHDLDQSAFKSLKPVEVKNESIKAVASRMAAARKQGAASIMMLGGHVIRAGVQRYIIDMVKRGLINCVSTNGSGVIHDFEFSLIGATTESVARYIKDGRFGLWHETGRINDIINDAYKEGRMGYGAAVGMAISKGRFPHKDISIAAACLEHGVPLTVHIGIGYDIIHEHPNFDGAAAGAMSYHDFLLYAGAVSGLEGGVVMNFGSAVMAPEVYLKALSMARNAALQEGGEIRHFTTLVCDLHDLPEDFGSEPPKNSPAYYFRPWKTMLVRTVADGGESFYVRGPHSHTIPELWSALAEYE